jgi:hypothetical protein
MTAMKVRSFQRGDTLEVRKLEERLEARTAPTIIDEIFNYVAQALQSVWKWFVSLFGSAQVAEERVPKHTPALTGVDDPVCAKHGVRGKMQKALPEGVSDEEWQKLIEEMKVAHASGLYMTQPAPDSVQDALQGLQKSPLHSASGDEQLD